MGRPSKARRLEVRMNGDKVGAWTLTAAGEHVFTYDPAWPDSGFSRPISLSMPIRPGNTPYRGAVVESFFDNLLPDSLDIRRRLQSRFGTTSPKAFDLLAEVGRECVGALQITPEGIDPGDPKTIQAKSLRTSGIAAALREAASLPAFGQIDDSGFRISLAGAQEKTAFLRHRGKWWRPEKATPTSHIFKLPMGDRIGREQIDMSASIENEWLCSRLAAAFDLPVAHCEMSTFEDQRALVVERFDRAWSSDGSWLIRLPQEDMCQAMGVPLGIKYEADGAPGIPEILRFLLGSDSAFEDRRRFLKTQVFFWLLAAVDGHARNFSVFIGRGGSFRLTPLYDILSAYPILGHGKRRLAPEKARMAMSVRGRQKHYHWRRITLRHWQETAAACGLGADIRGILSECIETGPLAAAKVAGELPAGFPGTVAEPILEGLAGAVKLLKNAVGGVPGMG